MKRKEKEKTTKTKTKTKKEKTTKKNQKIINGATSQIPNSNSNCNCNCNCNCNWLDLPDSLLLSILDLLSSSIPDLHSFAAVCTQWRSLSKSSSSTRFPTISSLPPLLLCCLHPPSTLSSLQRTCVRDLKTLTQDSNSRSFRSMVPLDRHFVGHSHGHLIFVGYIGNVLVADVFTRSNKFYPPKLDPCYSVISFGILTAPPSSPSCTLLLASENVILCWRLGSYDDHWSVLEIHPFQVIQSLVVFEGKVLGLLRDNSLFVLNFVPRMSFQHLEVQIPNDPRPILPPKHPYNKQYLVECNEKLLLVLFVDSDIPQHSGSIKVVVYLLDFPNGVWVELQGIENWCLFLDSFGRGIIARPNPAKWGGTNNSIYFAGLRKNSWIVFPLGDPFLKSLLPDENWPSPIWVYPSKLL